MSAPSNHEADGSMVSHRTDIQPGDTARVTTDLGTLLGQRCGHGADEVRVFRGVPYGVPPAGSRRWRHAEPVGPWGGERWAVAFGPDCPQPPLPEDDFFYHPIRASSEDCLYLNVWTPAEAGEALPVMVWIHGGGLVEGSGSSPAYDGAALARKGVVVVTINYRLGVLGFFAHPELTADADAGVPGNFGLTDQILALRWVRDHIGAFGGDPDRVTIFGQSAGALSVLTLLVSPLTDGLFHRAIAQSPYHPPMSRLREESLGMASAESHGEALSRHLAGASLAELRELPADRLVRASLELDGPGVEALPVVDGWVLPEQIFSLLERGSVHDVPLIVGLTSGESDHFAMTPGWSAPVPGSGGEYVEAVRARYGDLTDEYLALYPPNDLRQAVLAPIRDAFNGWPAEKLVRAAAAQNPNSYLYYFDHPPAWASRLGMGAFHAADLAYSFDHVEGDYRDCPGWPLEPPRASDIAMAAVMSGLWVEFARSGTPSCEGCEEWSPYDERSRRYLRFRAGETFSESNLNPGAYALHDNIFGERRRSNRPWLLDIGLSAPVLPPGR